MKIRKFGLAVAALAAIFTGAGIWLFAGNIPANSARDDPPFGGKADIDYAARLWQALEKARLVGAQTIRATPYEGQEPHGAILVTLEGTIKLGGHKGAALVKKNYVGPGVTKSAVANNPEDNLAAITVMYQREDGYDANHQNWFWAKYKPDGTLLTNPKGVKLAGRVAKGTNEGCIACHKGAAGGDYVFNHDRLKQERP